VTFSGDNQNAANRWPSNAPAWELPAILWQAPVPVDHDWVIKKACASKFENPVAQIMLCAVAFRR
ncbi:hypothetical protein, partial [Klebsiella variicola]|uniref:hypothetical protein n=1 Tax=Klebsiella variicola TaxID=244366 RepID=UPI00273195D9